MRSGERRLSIKQLQAALKTMRGIKPHYLTIWRWVRRGIRGVKLESRDAGGRIETSLEAYDRFERRKMRNDDGG